MNPMIKNQLMKMENYIMRILFEMDNALIREVLEETGLYVIRDSI